MDASVADMSSLAGIDLAALGAACEKYGVAELAVFGSVVTGEARPDSDIDVLYVLRDGVHLGWRSTTSPTISNRCLAGRST